MGPKREKYCNCVSSSKMGVFPVIWELKFAQKNLCALKVYLDIKDIFYHYLNSFESTTNATLLRGDKTGKQATQTERVSSRGWRRWS